ncbi:MAG: hypothetical protein ACP5D7_04890 [Limnospira sp.]
MEILGERRRVKAERERSRSNSIAPDDIIPFSGTIAFQLGRSRQPFQYPLKY